MALQLLVIEGPDKGQTFSLAPATFVAIGRGRSAQIRLNDMQVSREHCRICASGDGMVLSDAGSMGGTFVHGKPVRQHLLRPGDMIRLGQTLLRVQVGDLTSLPTLPPVPSDENLSLTHNTVSSLPHATGLGCGDSPTLTGPDPLPVDPNLASWDGPVPPIAPLPQERLGELAGESLWYYRLGQPLARGQSGLVFRSTDTRTARAVAIKVLWPQ